MNVHPTLTTHPKFLLYKQALKAIGGADAMEYLLRLWGHCQTRQLAENWGKVDDAYVEAICQWSGKPGELCAILGQKFCSKNGWIYRKKTGELIVTSWNEHNKSLLNSWFTGRKGGRPRKTRSKPADNPRVNPPITHGQPTENPIGLDRTGWDRSTEEEERSRFSEIPSDAEVFKLCQEWPGEPASGAPQIPTDYAEEWVSKMSGRTSGWPPNWPRKLIADWRKDFRTWGGVKKNGAKKTPRERWQVEKDLTGVREQLERHPRRTWPAGEPLPPEVKADFETLVAKRRELEKELSV